MILLSRGPWRSAIQRQQVERQLPRAGGGDGQSVSKEYGVPVLQDQESWGGVLRGERDRVSIAPLSCTLGNGYDGTFYVVCVLPQ